MYIYTYIIIIYIIYSLCVDIVPALSSEMKHESLFRHLMLLSRGDIKIIRDKRRYQNNTHRLQDTRLTLHVSVPWCKCVKCQNVYNLKKKLEFEQLYIIYIPTIHPTLRNMMTPKILSTTSNDTVIFRTFADFQNVFVFC